MGTNVVTATATDAAGNTASSQMECYYRPSLASLVEYEYDKNGCLIQKAIDGTYYTVYEYDYENRLVEVTLPDASTNEFVYDGDKRRVSRKDASGEEKWFLYDGINILQDLATDGTVWTSYVQGIGIDKLISVSEWSGQTSPQKRYYHSDAIGSVRSLTDEDETEVGTYTYDAWGKVISETGTSENEYKFTSRRWEQDLGLQYNRARFYDPETGRFITPDPLTGGPDDPSICYMTSLYFLIDRAIKEFLNGFSEENRINRYVYCMNNPVNFIDPLGLEVEADKIGSPNSLVAEIKRMEGEGKSNQEIYEAMKDFNNPNRYIYTQKDGWIDCRHYFAAMEGIDKAIKEHPVAFAVLGSVADSQAIKRGMQEGEKIEKAQAKSLHPSERKSSYSYEDLPSNLKGLQDGVTRNRGTKTISEIVKERMKESIGVSRESAPADRLKDFEGKKVTDATKPLTVEVLDRQKTPIEKTEESKPEQPVNTQNPADKDHTVADETRRDVQTKTATASEVEKRSY